MLQKYTQHGLGTRIFSPGSARARKHISSETVHPDVKTTSEEVTLTPLFLLT